MHELAEPGDAPAAPISVPGHGQEAAADGRNWIPLLAAAAIVTDSFDASSMAFAVSTLAPVLAVPVPAFGQVFAVTLAGHVIGALAVGLIGDLFSPRIALVLAALWTGIASMATAGVATFDALLVVRFAAGIGIGALVPAALVFAAKGGTAGRRGRSVLLGSCGIPVGGMLAGLAAGILVARAGWQSIFVVGGAAAIATGLAVVALTGSDRTARTVPARRARGDVADMFRGTYRWLTPLCWLCFILVSMSLWFLFSWLPTLLEAGGANQTSAAFVSGIFSLGGLIGLLLLAPLIDRHGVKALFLPVLLAAAALVALPHLPSTLLTGLLLLTAGAGCTMTQSGVTALAVMLYPPTCRSSMVGSIVAVGKIGALGGPLIGGALLSRGSALSTIYPLVAVPLVACFCCLVGLGRLQARLRHDGTAPSAIT